MLITDLIIDNFGPFAGVRLQLSPRLSIILGPNEAGKSAIRAFIRMVLFGFLRRTSKEYEFYNYPPVNGGAASGRVSVRSADGKSYTIARREGAHGGPVAVSGDGTGEADLLEALTGRISQEVYQGVFSVSLAELQDFESLNRSQASDRIYSAGLGLGSLSLPEVTRKLEDERSSSKGLWSPRGGRLRESLRQLNAKRAALARAREELATYEDLGKRESEVREQVDEATRVLRNLREAQERHRRLVELRPHWERHSQMLRRLDELPDFGGFPRDGLAALDKLEQELDRLRQQIDDGDGKRESREREAAQLQVVDSFVRNEAAIQRLMGEVEHYRSAAEDLPKRQQDLRDAEERVRTDLQTLGPLWNEGKLSEPLDIDRLQEDLASAGRALTNSRAELREAELHEQGIVDGRTRAKQSYEDLLRERESLSNVPSESADKLRAFEGKLGRLREALVDRGTVERERRDIEVRLADAHSRVSSRPGNGGLPSWAAALGLVAGIAVAVWGAVSGELSGVAAGLVLATVGLASIMLSRRSRADDAGPADGFEPVDVLAKQRKEVRDQAGRIDGEVATLVAELGLGVVPSEREVAERLNALSHEARQREEYDRVTKAVANAERDLNTTERRFSVATLRTEKAREKVEKATDEWAAVLDSAYLDTALEPPAAAAAVGQVQALREQVAAASSLRQRVRDMSNTIADIESRLAPVLEEAGLPGFQPGEAVAAQEHLEERHRQHRSAVERLRLLTDQDTQWDSERDVLVQKLDKVSEQKDVLLKAAETANEEAFKALGAELEKRRDLERELDALRRDQPLLVNQQGQRYRDELGNRTDEEVRAMLQELADEIKRAEEVQGQLHGDLRSVQDERRRMEESSATAGLRLEIGRLRETVNEDARRWAVLTIARELLEATRTEFQMERQAPLLRTASQHFEAFTRGRYANVQSVLGEERVQVVERSGTVKDVAALSRGTAEQLYLALRFALIDEYARNSEPMPVLMDDVMVNFDADRVRAVCDSVVGISERHQVLVLTCHPETVSQLRDAAATAAGAPEPRVIEI